MCQLCNGTHVIHEIDSYSIRTSCCPVCGPEQDDIWRARIETFIDDVRTKKEEIENVLCRW